MKIYRLIARNLFTSLDKSVGFVNRSPLYPLISRKLIHSTASFSSIVKMSDHILPNNTPFGFIDCSEAFQILSNKEKLYAYYLSKACWVGGLIVLVQSSLESPLIFILLHKLFQIQSPEELKQTALQCGLSEDEYTAFLIYACGFMCNMSNYRSMGDVKFIPNLPKEKFEKLLLSSKFGQQDKEYVESLMSRCLEKIYSLGDKEKTLGFPEIGTTSYLSKNVLKEDVETVKEYLKTTNREAFNSRLIKTEKGGKTCYEIRLSSVLDVDEEFKKTHPDATVNGKEFTITRGDFGKILDLVIKQLLCAKEHAANDNERQMIDEYVKSFRTGSLNAHKDGSRFWIKDKSPIVETYIGFIEVYRDPGHTRGEFEGFVAMVNKIQSEKFSKLVKSAEDILPLLPWPKEYEKDVFLQPDFTSLDILSFAGSGVPIGINIPNYDEIVQNEGFKNVSLGNVIRVPPTQGRNFLCQADQELMLKYLVPGLEVIVALHELLGHGSGKLFQCQNGVFNFDKDNVLHLEKNEKVSSWYEEGETYYSVFGSMSSAYEECKAESVGMYLSVVPKILKIFGFEGPEADEVMYSAWLLSIFAGLEALKWFDPQNKVWLQAHCQSAYVLLRVCIEAGEDFIKIERLTGTDGQPDLLFSMDRNKIKSVGAPAVGRLLKRLQLYKSTADISSAKEMFEKYSEVPSEGDFPFLQYRDIVVARKKPRKLDVQPNTFLEDGEVKLKNYDSTAEGMIKSWTDRYNDESLYQILEELWSKDKAHF